MPLLMAQWPVRNTAESDVSLAHLRFPKKGEKQKNRWCIFAAAPCFVCYSAGLPSQAGAMGRGAVSQTPWHPQGVLIAHLAEHRQGVNQLAVAANGLFFASASNDETVKVWDCRRLEKDVSFKSRLTYASQGTAPVSAWHAWPCPACIKLIMS